MLLFLFVLSIVCALDDPSLHPQLRVSAVTSAHWHSQARKRSKMKDAYPPLVPFTPLTQQQQADDRTDTRTTEPQDSGAGVGSDETQQQQPEQLGSRLSKRQQPLPEPQAQPQRQQQSLRQLYTEAELQEWLNEHGDELDSFLQTPRLQYALNLSFGYILSANSNTDRNLFIL